MHKLSALEIATQMKEGTISAVDSIKKFMKRAHEINPKVDALLEICEKRAEIGRGGTLSRGGKCGLRGIVTEISCRD